MQLLLERDLEVVPGHGLVVRRRGEPMEVPRARIERVDVVDALAAAVLRGGHVERRRRLLLHVRLDGPHGAAVARETPEPARRHGLGARDVLLGDADELRGLGGVVRRVAVERAAEVADAGVAELARELPARRFDAVEAREAVLVDAARVLVERRVGEDVVAIEPLPVGEMAHALTVAGMRLVALEQREPRRLGRSDERLEVADDRVALGRLQLRMGDEDRRLLDRGLDDPAGLGDAALDDRAGGGPAGPQSRLGVLDVRRDPGREGREARAQAVDPLLAVDALEPGELPDEPLRAAVLVDPVHLPERALVGAPEAADDDADEPERHAVLDPEMRARRGPRSPPPSDRPSRAARRAHRGRDRRGCHRTARHPVPWPTTDPGRGTRPRRDRRTRGPGWQGRAIGSSVP